MKLKVHNSLLQHAINRRNGYLVIACVSLVLNILLGIGIISMVGREKVILVPPKISETFWVKSNSVSAEYLSEMSTFISLLRFNLNPGSSESQRDTLLRYMSPEYYESLKVELINEATSMAKDHVTTAFYPVDIKTDVKRLQTLVTGDLLTTVGTNQLPIRRVVYKISFSQNNYRLLVKNLIEVKPDA